MDVKFILEKLILRKYAEDLKAVFVLLILSSSANARPCEWLLVRMPIVRAVVYGMPSPGFVLEPTSDDLALISFSESAQQELGLWTAYDSRGDVIAKSEIIYGDVNSIRNSLITDEFYRFWPGVKERKPFRIAFMHTHPKMDEPFGLFYKYHSFSSSDLSAGRFLRTMCLNRKRVGSVHFEMHLLSREDGQIRKIGYRVREDVPERERR